MDTITPRVGLPDWIPTLVIVLALIGFPIVVLLSWAFEITPLGLKKTEEVQQGESIVHATGRKLNVITISLLALALGYFVSESRFANSVQTPAIEVATEVAAPATITDKSIAVLPFADFSPGGDQAWFADGLSEEILNSLVRTADLKVASRTSSFAYRNTSEDIPEIARVLGVAHILEGSVRRTDTRLRITAQLIRAADGFHLWSENYDRTPEDAIAIQEDLAVSISEALQTAMDPAALTAMADVGTESIAAYNAYLEGRSLNCAVNLACVTAYERAIGFDPEFAEAQFQLANYWNSQLTLTTINAEPGISDDEILERFQLHISRVIEFAANPVDLLKYRAVRAGADLRLAEQRDLLVAYLESRPNDVQSWGSLAVAHQNMGDLPAALGAVKAEEQLDSDIDHVTSLINLYYQFADLGSAVALSRRVMVEAPTRRLALYQAHRALLWVGEVTEAAEAARMYHQSPLSGDPTVNDRGRSDLVNIRQACAEGRVADANRLFENFPTSGDATLHWLALMTLGRNKDAEDLLRIYDSPEKVRQLFSWYRYSQFDPRPFPLLMAVLEREGVTQKLVVPEPYPMRRSKQFEAKGRRTLIRHPMSRNQINPINQFLSGASVRKPAQFWLACEKGFVVAFENTDDDSYNQRVCLDITGNTWSSNGCSQSFMPTTMHATHRRENLYSTPPSNAQAITMAHSCGHTNADGLPGRYSRPSPQDNNNASQPTRLP